MEGRRATSISVEELMKVIGFGLALVLALNGLAYSQDLQPTVEQPLASNPQLAEKARMEIQKRGVGEKSRVTIRLRDRTLVKGYISQIEATSFQVTDKRTGRVSTITYDTVDRVRGGGLSRGSKIAIGVGVGAAIAVTVFALVVASWHGN
jgi:hypothetical protein